METQYDTPAQVAESLKRYLKTQGKLREAAERLGVRPTALSRQLSVKQYFTRKNAIRFAAIFNVNPDYLVTGQGELRPKPKKDENSFTQIENNPASTDTTEQRLTTNIQKKLQNLIGLACSYNNLSDQIIELAKCITQREYGDYYQMLIESLKKAKIQLDPRIIPNNH